MQGGRIKLDFYNGYCCRFWPTGVTRCPLQNMKKKRREVQWTLIRQAEIVSWIDTWEVIVIPVHRWPRCRKSTEDFPQGSHASRLCLRNITPTKLSTVALFRGVTLASVDWNHDQFSESSTTLFTVSESGVYWLKFPRAHLTQCKVYHS